MAKWKAPDGFVLTSHDGYHLNEKGFRAADDDESRYPDGKIGVAWWIEDEPFVAGQHASGEEGWSPNVQILPIADGWVPPSFELHAEDDDTPVVKPHDRAGEA